MGIVVEIVGIHSYVDIAGVLLSHLALSTPNLLDLIAVKLSLGTLNMIGSRSYENVF